MKYHKGKVNKQSFLKSHQNKNTNLGVNLTKEVKDEYAEKHKTLMKDIKGFPKWKEPMLLDCNNQYF